VDVAIALDLAPSAASDAYADTVDLAALARLVRATVAAPPRALLETIAVQTAQAILASFDRVTRVQLVVVKPEPAGLRAAAEVVRLDLGRN
jgi:dihydroneopterin aldolase